MWSPRTLVGIGFLMLLFTALQGWGMVGIIAFMDLENQGALLHDQRRLHNLGLSGGFLAISFGLTLIMLPIGEPRTRRICQWLLPSLLIAPVAFSDRTLDILVGPIPKGIQAIFYGLQAVSALGITICLAMMIFFLAGPEKPGFKQEAGSRSVDSY